MGEFKCELVYSYLQETETHVRSSARVKRKVGNQCSSVCFPTNPFFLRFVFIPLVIEVNREFADCCRVSETNWPRRGRSWSAGWRRGMPSCWTRTRSSFCNWRKSCASKRNVTRYDYLFCVGGQALFLFGLR